MHSGLQEEADDAAQLLKDLDAAPNSVSLPMPANLSRDFVQVMLVVVTFNFTTRLNIKPLFQRKPRDRWRPSIKCRQPGGKVRERHISCQTDPRGNAA